jgi:hypothetical protein
VRKAFMRGLYMVPTGEKDGDETAPRDDAPVTKGVTRAAAPRPTNAAIHPVASAVVSQGRSSTGNGAQPKRIAEFFSRDTYEIDRSKFLSWSDWETYYLKIADHANDLDQIIKLDDDNKHQCVEFSRAVKPAVYNRFREHVKANAHRLVPPFVEESDTPSILDQMREERRQSQGGDV